VGGDIIIGRDEATGVLARETDVSGAKLESQGGFVETSGMQMAAEGIQVKAKDWLLDPVDIEINNGGNGTQTSYSQISNTTINTALNAGTTVTIQTTGSGSTSLTPNPTWSGTGGRVLVSGALSKTTSKAAALTLTADTQIDVNNSIGNTAGTLVFTLNAPTVNSSSSGIISGVNLTVNNTMSGTMAGVISNSSPTGSFTKNGIGTISLTGTNTYTGNTAVNSGTFQVTNMASFVSANVNIASGAVFEANVTSNSKPIATTGSGVTFTGDGTFRKTGTSAFTLRNNLFGMYFTLSSNGLIDVQQGALQVDGSAPADALFGSNNFSVLNINSGAVFDILSQKVFFRGITGAGTIFNSYSRSALPTFDTLVVGNGVTDSKVSYDFSGVIGGSISNVNTLQANYDKKTSSYVINLNKSGAGTQILSGNNIYIGTTNIVGGTLQIGNGGASGTLGIGAVSLADKTHLKFLRNTDTIVTNTITGTGSGDVFANITSNSGVAANLNFSNNISLGTGSVNLNADGDFADRHKHS
jgi:autotransporter-associated beta strand protein